MRYLIGIDLGTTNSALASIDLNARPPPGAVPIHTFAVPQLVGPGELGSRQLLPSFLYLPGTHDLPPGATTLPWNPTPAEVIGEFARNHGSRVPGRLVSSAKSWLCHPGVDRTAPLLPWAAPPDVPRLSPLEASSRYLRHMVEAWDHAPRRKEEDKLGSQSVVLTVPASFDDVARNLTVEAAKQAGLTNVTLLEEPQAAFYAWLATHSGEEAGKLKPGMRCLVVDVGGGTSDFSLIRADEEKGEMAFVREAVGDHLLLGGDNMDLALARAAETKLNAKLDAAQFGMLIQACRQAKEALLSPEPPDSYSVTVMGRGRSVIGGTLHATLTPDDVRRALFDGFFPAVGPDDAPQRTARTGLHEMGLPYVSDPAVTRHLAEFLRRQSPTGKPTAPDAILFNGGVFQASALRERLVEVMRPWFAEAGKSWEPLLLTNPSLDLAVAWGAAYSAWLRHTGGRRIGGGIARSYYIAIHADESHPEESSPPADDKGLVTVLCVVPRRMEEGVEIELPKPKLELVLGQPVLFPLFTSTVRGDDQAGDLLLVSPDQLLQLPPLHTVLRGGKRSTAKSVPVTLATRCTEIGTLEIYCVGKGENQRWRLEFNVRDLVKEAPVRAEGDEADDRAGVTDVWPEEQVQEAGRLIRGTFAESGEPNPPPADLTKAMETALEASRDDWPTGLCRRLWEFLSESADARSRTGPQLTRWYHLAGFCLRPGFGDALDRYRVDQLWKMITAPPKSTGPVTRPGGGEGGSDYWIMWRRVAGGLNQAVQNALFTKMKPHLLPGKGRTVAKPSANELAEMWRAAASLERLDTKSKEHLGLALLKQIKKSPAPTHAFWALTRIGARVLFYGPLNAVIQPAIAEGWLDQILSFEPGHPSERLNWAFCLAQLARRSGQRALDVDESHRQSVLTVLKSLDVPAGWPLMVEEVHELAGEENRQMFGESLPIGLRLLGKGS